MKMFVLLIGVYIFLGCTAPSGPRSHFFLASYPNLEFRDSLGTATSSRSYIRWEQLNSVTTYQIEDASLTLVDRETGQPYTGSVKAFHWFAYNLQADYEAGKMMRLRYWHPNGVLGMDLDKRSNMGKTWNEHEQLAIDWRGDETVYYNPSTSKVREIRKEERREYYDRMGQMTYYRVQTDTAIWLYYPNDSPRMIFPYHQGLRMRNGIVKQWHPNGQLKAIGRYENNEETGTWIGYDTLGVEIERQIFEHGKLIEKKPIGLSK